MDDGSSETCLDWLNNMNFKNIVWFIKAISYFVLLRSLGNNNNNNNNNNDNNNNNNIIIIIIIIIVVIVIVLVAFIS